MKSKKNRLSILESKSPASMIPTCDAIIIGCDSFHVIAECETIVVGFFSFPTQQEICYSHFRDGKDYDRCSVLLAVESKDKSDYLVQPDGSCFTEVAFPDYTGWSFEGFNIALYKQDSQSSGYCEVRFTLVKNPNHKFL